MLSTPFNVYQVAIVSQLGYQCVEYTPIYVLGPGIVMLFFQVAPPKHMGDGLSLKGHFVVDF